MVHTGKAGGATLEPVRSAKACTLHASEPEAWYLILLRRSWNKSVYVFGCSLGQTEVWYRLLEMRCRCLSQHKELPTHCIIETTHCIATSVFVNTTTKMRSNHHCYIRGFGICHVKSTKAEDARQLAKGSLASRLGG
jgi:hypothetical protein